MHDTITSQAGSSFALLPLVGSTRTIPNFWYWRAAQILNNRDNAVIFSPSHCNTSFL
jgi:hypothetical protein